MGQKEASWAGLVKTNVGKRRSLSPAQTPGLLTDLLTLLASTGNADYKVGKQKLASESGIWGRVLQISQERKVKMASGN